MTGHFRASELKENSSQEIYEKLLALRERGPKARSQ